MKTLILIAMLLAPTLGRAVDWTWTPGDTYREVGVIGAIFLDWQSTRYALRQPGFTETNPFLGAHPSRAKLDLMVGMAAIGHVVVTRLIPNPYRKWWQYASIVAEVDSWAMNTYVLGGVKFYF